MSDPNRKEYSYSEKSNNSDLIYRQDAINEAEQWIKIYSSGRGGQRERDAIKQVISGIKKLPSAQPEIIRCKDCKFWKKHGYINGKPEFLPKCGFNQIYTSKDDFCSRAERKK